MLSSAREKRKSTDIPPGEASAIFADRIDLLFRLGRIHLFLPFSAFCVVAMLYTGREAVGIVVVPLLLQIAAAVTTGRLARRYARRDPSDDPEVWADRYTMASAFSGAAWGVGAFIWHIPDSFTAEAFFALAFLGMTATEFMTQCAYRPAYLVHAALSLGPLALRLVLDGNIYASLSAVLVLFFGGILFADCDAMANLLDTSLRMRRHNADLISRLSQEHAELEMARDLAEHANRSKTNFLASMSHELRTPLNAIIGFSDILKVADLQDKFREYANYINSSGKALLGHLNNILDMARLDSGAVTLSQEESSIAEIVSDAVDRVKAETDLKERTVYVTVAKDLTLHADIYRLRQIVENVLSNAIKFTGPDGNILIKTLPCPDGGFELHIKDDGIGISPEQLPTIMEPFNQVESVYARSQGGVGLGVPIAKSLVELHGGRLTITSKRGYGTQVQIYFPPALGATKASTRQLP